MHRFAFAAAIVALASSSALANPEWYGNTTEKTRSEAAALFYQGRQLRQLGASAKAATELQGALALWDHPMARFELGNALAGSGDAAGAVKQYAQAMRFGGQPLDAGTILVLDEQAHDLLANRVALVVVQNETGGPLRLDKESIPAGRGDWSGVVASGAIAFRDTNEKPHLVAVDASTAVTVKVTASGASVVNVRRLSASDLAEVLRVAAGRPVTLPSRDALSRWQAGQPARDAWVAESTSLPGDAEAICAKARGGELETVCKLFRTEHAELVDARRNEAAQRAEASKRVQELTRGGVVDALK